jgi:hypothetical protein
MLLLRQVLVSLTVFAVVAATTVHATPSMSVSQAAAGAMVSMDRDACTLISEMKPVSAETANHGAACNTPSLDCAKSTGCLGVLSAMSGQPVSLSSIFFGSRVTYLLPDLFARGISPEPDYFPPIAI